MSRLHMQVFNQSSSTKHRRSATSMTDAAAQYKKQDGTVAVSADGKSVAWKSANGALPPLAIAIADIASRLQHAQECLHG